ERAAVGSTIKTIGFGYFERLHILLPPLAVQRSVAAILLHFDELLQKVALLTARKWIYRQALAERLLTGSIRFPAFSSTRWSQRSVGEYFSERSERYDGRGDTTVLSCSKLYGVLPQSERFDRRVASQDLSNYKVVEPGDLVLDPMLLWDASIGFA